MTKKQNKTSLPSGQAGLLSFSSGFSNSSLSFKPEFAVIAGVILAVAIIILLKTNPFGF